MGRQLFLHHYLPAHLASSLVAGALIEFIFNTEPVVDDDARKTAPEKVKRGFQSPQERLKGQSMIATWIAVGVIMSAVLYGWWFFLPLTYGRPGLTVEQVNARKWLGYDLHFAK
jgi:dolichyl-phosphate-mannose-protein mannosyltransferase